MLSSPRITYHGWVEYVKVKSLDVAGRCFTDILLSSFSRCVWAPTFCCCSHLGLIQSSLTITEAILYERCDWVFPFAILAWYYMRMCGETLFCTVMLDEVFISIQSVGLCACGSDFFIHIFGIVFHADSKYFLLVMNLNGFLECEVFMPPVIC